MPMDRQLRRKIIRFITPFFQDMHNRQSIVDNAFWGEDFQNQVDTSGTPKGFAEHLLKQVDTYHGISGIKQLLKTFHDDITPGRKDEIEALLEELDPPVEKATPVTPETGNIRKNNSGSSRRSYLIAFIALIFIGVGGVILYIILSDEDPSAETAYMFLVDRSEVMGQLLPGTTQTRYRVAQEVVGRVSRIVRPDDDFWLGLGAFGGGEDDDCNLYENFTQITAAQLREQNDNFAKPLNDTLPGGNSANNEAFRTGYTVIPENEAKNKFIFLFLGSLDGSANCPGDNLTAGELKGFRKNYGDAGITLQFCVLTFFDETETSSFKAIFGEDQCAYNIEDDTDVDIIVDVIQDLFDNPHEFENESIGTNEPTQTSSPTKEPTATDTSTNEPEQTETPQSNIVNTDDFELLADLITYTDAGSFSPDSQLMAINSWDKRLRLWDVTTGLSTMIEQEDGISQIIFSPDGQLLAAKLWSRGSLWDVATGTRNDTFRPYNVSQIIFSPDGQSLAVSSSNRISLWDTTTGTQRNTFEQEDRIYQFLFSPDSQLLAVRSSNRVTLGDVATEIHYDEFKSGDGISQIIFSPDGQFLAIGSGSRVFLRDVATRTQRDVFEHSSNISQIVFSPDGQSLAVRSSNSVTLWDVATGTQHDTFDEEDRIYQISFSPDSQSLAIRLWNSVSLWNIATGIQHSIFEPEASISQIIFSPDGQLLAARSSSSVSLWDMATRTQHSILEQKASISQIIFSPDGQLLALIGRNSTRLYAKNIEQFDTCRLSVGNTPVGIYTYPSRDARTIRHAPANTNFTVLGSFSSSWYWVEFPSDVRVTSGWYWVQKRDVIVSGDCSDIPEVSPDS